MLTELTHIKEIMDKLHLQAAEPFVLSPNNERVILDRTRMGVDNMNGAKVIMGQTDGCCQCMKSLCLL